MGEPDVDKDGDLWEPIGAATPGSDPDIVSAEGRGIRARIPRGPSGDAKLGAVLVRELTELVREGNTVDNAARVCGVRRPLLGAWLAKGKDDVEAGLDTPEARLCWSIDAALGDQEQILVRGVMDGAKKDPRLALDVLSRRRPADWAVATAEREDLKQLYGKMNESELKAEVQRLLAAGKKEE